MAVGLVTVTASTTSPQLGVVRVAGTATADDAAARRRAAHRHPDGGRPRATSTPSRHAASATFTETGYPVDRTRNGVPDDKGWSNWVSGTKPAQSTLTYQFAKPHQVQQVTVRFYRDGTTAGRSRCRCRCAAPTARGSRPPAGRPRSRSHRPADGSAPVVTAEFAPVTATGVRVIMNAYPATHMIVSEVQVFESVPSPAAVSDLAVLRLDGEPIDGFDPARAAYEVDVDGGRLPVVDAIAVDSAATVRITQPTTANGGVATIAVTSADGSARTRGHGHDPPARGDRRPAARRAAARGHARCRRPARSTRATARSAWQWFLNGEPIAGATAQTYTPETNDAGKELSVRVDGVGRGRRAGYGRE